MFKNSLLLSIVVCAAVAAQAQSSYKGTSEAAAIVVNAPPVSSSETYSAKTKNIYTIDDLSSLTGFGSYIFGKTKTAATGEVKSADALNLGLRYDYTITKDVFGLFIQAQYDKDIASATPFDNKISYDLGMKYVIHKTDSMNWFAELGYRHADQRNLDDSTVSLDYGRLYTELANKWNESTNTKLWVEYLPGLNDKTANAINAEASVSVAMNSILSLKTGLLLNHFDEKASAGMVKSDKTTWTTALVANY